MEMLRELPLRSEQIHDLATGHPVILKVLLNYENPSEPDCCLIASNKNILDAAAVQIYDFLGEESGLSSRDNVDD